MMDEKDQEIAALKERLSALEKSPSVARPKKRMGCLPMLLWGLGGLIVVGAIGSALGTKNGPSSTTADSSAAAAAPTDGSATSNTTGNALNDALMKKSPARQAAILGKIVGEGCRGKRAFYDGVGHSGLADRQAF